MLQHQYPTLFPESDSEGPKTSLFTKISIIQRQKKDASIAAQLQEVYSYLGVESKNTLNIQCYGKCPLSNATLTSEIFEGSKRNHNHSSKYFEAQLGKSKDQDIDETELEMEKTKPIFGKALAFYKVEERNLSLVTYHALIERQKLHGRWYGTWSSTIYVLEVSAIVSLIGIYTYNDHVHIFRRHPGLSLLTPDEYDWCK